MSTDLCETDFVGTAARLKADPVSVPWPDRCELARRLGEALSAGHDRSDAMALVQLLARDSKWEVRAEIAQLLPVVSDTDFQELAPLLAGDCNHSCPWSS